MALKHRRVSTRWVGIFFLKACCGGAAFIFWTNSFDVAEREEGERETRVVDRRRGNTLIEWRDPVIVLGGPEAT